MFISPCAGCDSPTLARILALSEAVSGLVTILKSAWWYFIFRIPDTRNIFEAVQTDAENPIDKNDEHQSQDECQSQLQISVNNLETDTNSNTSYIKESNTNNILWTLTGCVIGILNIILGLFLLVALSNVNYVFLVCWCISFPLLYLLDCTLFTFLLKHCTTKERFERCKSHYISSTIASFVLNAYVLWVGISVIHWCNCRKDPEIRCRFQRDYCYSFNLNFSKMGNVYFYGDGGSYNPLTNLSF